MLVERALSLLIVITLHILALLSAGLRQLYYRRHRCYHSTQAQRSCCMLLIAF